MNCSIEQSKYWDIFKYQQQKRKIFFKNLLKLSISFIAFLDVNNVCFWEINIELEHFVIYEISHLEILVISSWFFKFFIAINIIKVCIKSLKFNKKLHLHKMLLISVLSGEVWGKCSFRIVCNLLSNTLYCLLSGMVISTFLSYYFNSFLCRIYIYILFILYVDMCVCMFVGTHTTHVYGGQRIIFRN